MKGCDFMYTRYVCSYCGKEINKWLNTENITKLRQLIWLAGKTRATFVTTHTMYMVANLIVNIKWIANTETAINTSTERI